MGGRRLRWRRGVRQLGQPAGHLPVAERLRHDLRRARPGGQRLECRLLRHSEPVHARVERLLTTTNFTAFQPGLGVFGDVPNEDPLPPPETPRTTTRFTLAPGQTATIVGTSLNGDEPPGDAAGVRRSRRCWPPAWEGPPTRPRPSQNFMDSGAGGTYYVEITGDQGTQYSLVVTKDSTFSLQPEQDAEHRPEHRRRPEHRCRRCPGLPRERRRHRGRRRLRRCQRHRRRQPLRLLAAGHQRRRQRTTMSSRRSTRSSSSTTRDGNQLFAETLDSFFAGTGQTSSGDVYVVWDPLASAAGTSTRSTPTTRPTCCSPSRTTPIRSTGSRTST